MRRLTLAALSAAFLLSACSDTRESPTEPSTPSPEETFGSRCQVTRFPLIRAARLIVQVFPAGRLRIEAVLRAGTIALLWDTCKPVLARKGVVAFVEFMNRNSARLVGTQQQKIDLIAIMFTGVGLASPPPIPPGPDFGIGGVDPAATTPTLIETQGSTALIQFLPAQGARPAAFNEFTIVTISRRPDDFRLTGFPAEDQHPPFFDFTATNASNNHVLTPGSVATMVVCFLGGSDFPNPNGYPDGVRIGHNPDASVPGPRFEIIPEAGPSDLASNLQCSNLHPTSAPPPPPVIGGFGGGVSGFARAAWSTAGYYLGPIARTLFLPAPLRAATIVGGRGPLSGLPPNLSDFGVVNATSYFGFENDEEEEWDPTGFWNRSTLIGIPNTASPMFVTTVGSTLPAPTHGSYAGWYGQPSTGNYIGTQATGDLTGSGGTSAAPNMGIFLSPEFDVPNVSANVELRFKTWWEIEGVNPGGLNPFDVMSVEIEHNEVVTVLKRLNPAADPTSPADRRALAYTSGGFNVAPIWKDEAINISAYKGENVRIRFVFNTRDVSYNGFRGWIVDGVRISTGTSPSVSLRLDAQQSSQGELVPADQLPPAVRP